MCTKRGDKGEGGSDWRWCRVVVGWIGWVWVACVCVGGVGSVEKFRNEYPCKYARIVSAANCSVFCRGSANNRFAFQR